MVRASRWRPPLATDGSDPLWQQKRLRALSYVVGVLLKGDGSVYATSHVDLRSRAKRRKSIFRLELKNKSIAFLNAFNLSLSVVLGRARVKIGRPNKDHHSMVRYSARFFRDWWRHQSLLTLRPLIEKFPVEYIRGRFDSDCNVATGNVALYRTEKHREVMEFERLLCKSLGMRVGVLRKHGRPGEVSFVGSRKIVSKQQKLVFIVNIHDFLRVIGNLNVEWRNRKLQSAVQKRRWTVWPSPLREKALEIQKDTKLQPKAIANRLSIECGRRVPVSTVYFWLKKGTRTWGEYYSESESQNPAADELEG